MTGSTRDAIQASIAIANIAEFIKQLGMNDPQVAVTMREAQVKR